MSGSCSSCSYKPVWGAGLGAHAGACKGRRAVTRRSDVGRQLNGRCSRGLASLPPPLQSGPRLPWQRHLHPGRPGQRYPGLGPGGPGRRHPVWSRAGLGLDPCCIALGPKQGALDLPRVEAPG
eukprot:365149-Chlamydomonas_euryale.AAC.12